MIHSQRAKDEKASGGLLCLVVWQGAGPRKIVGEDIMDVEFSVVRSAAACGKSEARLVKSVSLA